MNNDPNGYDYFKVGTRVHHRRYQFLVGVVTVTLTARSKVSYDNGGHVWEKNSDLRATPVQPASDTECGDLEAMHDPRGRCQ